MTFITKKHLPRRTFLRGMGVSLALPLLDSMVPAQTPLAKTAATPKSRFCFSPADFRLAQDLAHRAAMAVDNSRLYDQAQRAMGLMRVAEAKASGIVAVSADAIISTDERYQITLERGGGEDLRIFAGGGDRIAARDSDPGAPARRARA